ncbi:mucin-2-like [Scomber scombrus]|uniref:mucin-2-like n=1 Tax=Scomber scombrus TaxID=13677 RepID=UPI002DD9247F|nr:mucin-2-like [Scomber scombrus]
MTSQRWMMAVSFSLALVLETSESITTTETQKYTCMTFGSGVVQPFNGSVFYMRSTCPFTLTRFTHNRVECDITIRRGDDGLMVQVEIIINKVRTELMVNGSILVEKSSVSLPYDHTYQHIFQYGIYTRLRSSVLPLSVTWHSVPGGIDTLWVELNQELNTDMTGLCGKHNMAGTKQQLITDSVLTEDTCQTRDPGYAVNYVCREFFSYAVDCLKAMMPYYMQLCEENIYGYEQSQYIGCAFFKEVVQQCGSNSRVWPVWRALTQCVPPSCTGDLMYNDIGPAFIPSCSNPNPTSSNQDLTNTCMCPEGTVLNDHADGFSCIDVANCPCVLAGRSYSAGDTSSTKCQSCLCDSGRWHCSEKICPVKCLVEGQFVTTFDGKQYAVPGKCTYVTSEGPNWSIVMKYSEKAPSVKTVVLQLFQETYTFTDNMVKFGEKAITELHQSDHALVYWQSSMYVRVHTYFGLEILVQMSPEIQLDITPPTNHTGTISGLCGNSNNDTTDDFTTSSRIIENSAQPFAQSWSVGVCIKNIPPTCISTDNEIFAEEKCDVLNDPRGVFSNCHGHIPTDQYHMTCIQRTCNCDGNLQQCLCLALASYAKACAHLGVEVGDWRKSTDCTPICQKNQRFYYDLQACNRTCLYLSDPDPRCGLDDTFVEGCGCPEGTYLNKGNICTPKAECQCHYTGGAAPPGAVVIDGQQCICENGKLTCSKDCGCSNGMVCVHCSQHSVNTAQKTCDSLSKPRDASMTCESGCYCPHNHYIDHHGNCVSSENCTCMYSGKVFSAGQSVKTNCKTCTCSQAQWNCTQEQCPGKCQIYGNGHYETFDYKWYRFDGHCQYTLVEDDCGHGNGTFSIRVESVPCCDEALTCSRAVVLDLQDEVTLTLSDMMVTRLHKGWSLQEVPLYTTHTVGLYIIISVPSRGITLIWDKHTRITIQLSADWRNRVCGLCGNFDSNEMNDLQISGSAVVSSPLAFGNSWKATSLPCSDVTTEIFPCERNSYCLAWAQRRCMILTGDTFKDCHLKVDPEPYYHACVQESCSCQFEGKFLGFCTAVAAYAEACSEHDVCVKWRTPDLCPVYCDFYNEQGQCSWHYEACGEIQTCGKGYHFTYKLEGCYPRCPKEAPYYDENTGQCTKLRNCTCYFNDTVIWPGTVVMIQSNKCSCENGIINCSPTPSTPSTTTKTSTMQSTTSTLMTSTPSTTTATWSTTPSTSSAPTITNVSSITKTWSTTPSTTSTPMTTITNVSTTTENRSTTPPTTSTLTSTHSTTTATLSTTPSTSSPPVTTITNVSTTTKNWSTTPSITSTPMVTITNVSTTTENSSTTPPTTSTLTSTHSITTATSSTTPSTSSPPVTTITNISGTTKNLSATPSISSTPMVTITNVSTTTENSSTTPPTTSTLTSTHSTTTSTLSTTPSTSSPPVTTITNVSGTTKTWSTTPSITSTLTSSTHSTTTATLSTTPSTSSPPVTTITNVSTTTKNWSTTPSITSTPMVTITNVSTTTENSSTTPPTTSTLTSTHSITTATSSTTPSTSSPPVTTITNISGTTKNLSATPSISSTPMVTITNVSTTTENSSTTPPTTSTLTSTHSTTTSTLSTTPSTNSPPVTTITNVSGTTKTWSTTPSITSTLTSSTHSTTTATSSMTPSTSSPPVTTTTNVSGTTGNWSTTPSTTSTLTSTHSTTTATLSTTPSTSSPPVTTITNVSGTTKTWSTTPSITSTLTSSTHSTTTATSSMTPSTSSPGCFDGESWTEDCFNMTCNNGIIKWTPLACPEPVIPNCPRGEVSKVSDGCCDTWKCNCRCELYGDPHYISFQGVEFSFLDYCTYILMEERSPYYQLTIAVDNFNCDMPGSCAKGIIMNYQNSTATLKIIPHLYAVQATLNNVTIQPPYEAHGLRFETTDYIVSIYLPELRSHVSLSPYYVLEVSLAMEHFVNNTQGQCGLCGGESCIRKGGQVEDDSCCDKTAYDWVYADPGKPACASAPRDIPCHPESIPPPTCNPGPGSPLCEMLLHPVFENCSQYVDLLTIKKNCEFDSCRNSTTVCSSLEQAAKKCKVDGWRKLTNGTCEPSCPEGLVYIEYRNKLDDFCYGGVRQTGASLESDRAGCFCPSGQFRAGNHSNACVDDCQFCKGPLGELKLPGDVWESNCHICTCNNQTRTEKCHPKPAPICGPNTVLVKTSCCDITCVEKTCSYDGKTYKVGDTWEDAAHPCILFTCEGGGVQAKENRISDDQHCSFTCNQSCVPMMSTINITIDNCTTSMKMPVCHGQCVSQSGGVLNGVLQGEPKCRSCQELSSETRSVALQCSDLTTRQYDYKHITSCDCRACTIQW